MGWRSWSDSSEVGQRDFDTGGTNGIDVYLGMAVSKGMIGAAAIGWAVEESNRRNDISRQVAAQSSEAAAIASLAAALQAGTTSSVVRDVLGRLSERTQYAVRQQLAGSGLLG
jgi:Flp pilus assembly protein TadB